MYNSNQFSETPQTPPPAPAPFVAPSLGSIVTAANVLVALILIVAMIADRHSATTAALAGIFYFSVSTTAVLLTLSGTLTQVITNGQVQRTIRQLNTLRYAALEQAPHAHLVDPLRLTSRPTTPTLALPPSYVSAIPPADERLKLSCLEFVNALFLDNGTPNPKRILGRNTKRPGQVQYAKPRPDVLAYLHGLQMIWVEEDAMLFWDTDAYPHRADAVEAIRLSLPIGG